MAGHATPNVLLIIDTSGRMADSAPSNAYVATKRYPVQRKCAPAVRKGRAATTQPCPSGAVFKDSGYAHYADSLSGVTGSGAGAARSALAASGHWSGSIHGASVTLATGNYVNYLLGRCEDGGACLESKLTSATRVLGSVIDAADGVRFGIMTVHSGSEGGGARVMAPLGSDGPAMKSALKALAPARDAPLGEALHDAGQYFKGEPLTNGTSFPSPIQLGCQPNHVILITDGMKAAGARSLTAEATLRRAQDHSASLADVQRVTVHTIGLGVTAEDVITELKQAAESGGGMYVRADSVSELEATLTLVLARVKQVTYSFTSPLVPTVGITGNRRAYLASFQPAASGPFWRGSLKAYQRDASGVVPVDATGLPLASSLVWDAGRALTNVPAGRRSIYTEIAGALTPFAKSNSAVTKAMLGVSTTAERNRVIDFIRGVDVNAENRRGGTRDDRPWKLGAIVHSNPVLVSAPVLALGDPSYQAFKSAQAKRTKVLIVGADDGMLHAFRESDGVEIWAFIPRDMLERLHALSVVNGDHASFVDASPVAVDIKVAGTWRTIVIVGCRRGGPHYYALDITDTTSPKFLWSFTDPKIQESWSEPAIGKVRLGGIDRYVAFVGGGHSTSENSTYGKAFFVVDLAGGTKLWEYAETSDASDDRRYMNFSVPANPTAVDTDNDGYVDRVYVGDVGGQMWKFDVSAAETSGWKGKRLFSANRGQGLSALAGDDGQTHAIHAAPAVALDHHRNIWLFFGTGAPRQPNATSSGRFYGLKDDTDMINGATLTETTAGLKNATAGGGIASRGWYVILPGRAETPVAAPHVFNSTVFFSTFTPDRDGGCGAAGGSARLYALQASSGYAAMDFTSGTALAAPNATTPRSRAIGRGVGSMPVVIGSLMLAPGAPLTASVIATTVNQEMTSTAIPAPPFLKQVKSWRERIH